MDNKLYEYPNRYVVEFSNKTRASYSKKIYGNIINKVISLSLKEDKKIWNYYEIDGETILLYIWRVKDQKEYICYASIEDLEMIKSKFWHINDNGYVITRVGGKLLYLHREICGLTEEEYNTNRLLIDHIDRNPLNNKRENLRKVDFTLNARNSTTRKNRLSKTGFRGVHYKYDSNKNIIPNIYRVRINKGKDYIEEEYDSFEKAKSRRLELEKQFGYIRKFND